MWSAEGVRGFAGRLPGLEGTAEGWLAFFGSVVAEAGARVRVGGSGEAEPDRDGAACVAGVAPSGRSVSGVRAVGVAAAGSSAGGVAGTGAGGGTVAVGGGAGTPGGGLGGRTLGVVASRTGSASVSDAPAGRVPGDGPPAL